MGGWKNSIFTIALDFLKILKYLHPFPSPSGGIFTLLPSVNNSWYNSLNGLQKAPPAIQNEKNYLSIEKLPSKRKSNSLKKLSPCWNSNVGIMTPPWLMAAKIKLMPCSPIISQRTFKNFITKLTNKICQA